MFPKANSLCHSTRFSVNCTDATVSFAAWTPSFYPNELFWKQMIRWGRRWTVKAEGWIGLGVQRAGNRGHAYRHIDRYTRRTLGNWGTGSNLWHPKVGLSANCSPEFWCLCWAKLNQALQLSQQNNTTTVSSHFCLILFAYKTPPLNPLNSDFYLDQHQSIWPLPFAGIFSSRFMNYLQRNVWNRGGKPHDN